MRQDAQQGAATTQHSAKIRAANVADAVAIYQLIQPYIDDFAINAQGRDKFRPERLAQLLAQQDLNYWVYEDACVLGVIGYKHSGHLIHFFVAPSHLGHGIGRALWAVFQAWLSQQALSIITVNSSCSAKAIYEHLGFIAQEPVTELGGIRSVFMQKNLELRHRDE